MAEDSIIDKLSETRGKLSFIDSDGVVKSRMDDSFLRKFDISRDMNDADIDHYEEIVNDLADKLEKLNAEKSDLQLISSALGERLQRLGKEKEEALQSSTASFEKERQFFQSRIADLESQLKKMVLICDCSASAKLFIDLCILFNRKRRGLTTVWM